MLNFNDIIVLLIRIVNKCAENFKVSLWLKGLIQNVPFDLINKEFLKCDTESKIYILKKIVLAEQFELLQNYNQQNTFEQTFEILEKYLKSENSLSYYFELNKEIFNSEFFKDKIGNDLLILFNNYVSHKATEDEKYNLFFKGLTQDLSLPLAIENATSLNINQCKKLLKTYSSNQGFAYELLNAKTTGASQEDLKWIVTFAKEYLNNQNFDNFDKELFNIINPLDYHQLWEAGKVNIFPENYIQSILNEKYEDYDKLKNWIDNNLVSPEKIKVFLLNYLNTSQPVTDRIIFYRQYNHIKFIVDLDKNALKNIIDLKNDFYLIILWFLGSELTFDYDLLATKFIYFSPDDQVKIIRKLFSLKANGTIQLTIDDLSKLTRVDLDLYRINQKFNPEIIFDISTEVILNALLSYSKENKFLIGGQLLSLVLNNLNSNKTRKFKLTDYFEKCKGRTIGKHNWNTNGTIRKEPFVNKEGVTTFYYSISFSRTKTVRVLTQNGWVDKKELDNNFYIVEAHVKAISGRKWNAEKQHWGIPAQFESEVYSFAKNNRFLLDFDGNNYANNPHLVSYSISKPPNGISFCEGRLANKQDEYFKKEFWRCANQKCFQKCETYHTFEDWESYTLLDFCEILGLNTNETNRMGDLVPKGHYYQFISLINRFNQLLEKLYCKECNEILHPVDNAYFAAYTVVRFCCENGKCGQHKKEIYLNHCLNGQCNSIIDSRVSLKCNNGLYICENCGSCCSHSFFERRLNVLKTADNLDNAKKVFIFNDTKRKYDNKLGHLDKAEYFCYKCNVLMPEISTDVFVCNKCNIKYDTTKYKIKRLHKHLRTTNTNNTTTDFDDNFL